MKKMIIGLLAVGVLIVSAFIFQHNTKGNGFSVHDLNWDDIEGMNSRVFEAFYTDSPYIYDAHVGAVGYHEAIFSFFRDNLDLIRDRQQDRDLGYKVHFVGITGEESFLGNILPSIWEENNGEFELIFYFDRSLDLEFFDVLRESNREYAMALNPGAFNEQIITLAEVDWESLREGYESHISSVSIQGVIEDGRFSLADFESGRDALAVILEFLERNQEEFRSVGDLEYTYQGTIHFWRNDDVEPRIMSSFFMNDALNRRLIETIGEEAWEQARR